MISPAHIFIFNKYEGVWDVFQETGTADEKQKVQHLTWLVISDFRGVAELVKTIQSLIGENSDPGWSGFDTIQEFSAYLSDLHRKLLLADFDALEKVYVDFLPTSTFQEIAVANAISPQYGDLASAFEVLYDRLCRNQDQLELPHRATDEYSEN
ncbi:MAG: hypothetical protein ACRCYO_08245 [Bacteroidia bacterium]